MHERSSIKDILSDKKRVLAAFVAACALTSLGIKGCDYTHDKLHPTIGVGVKDDDVTELAELLERSSYSAYDAEGTPTVADEEMMGAVIDFQTSSAPGADEIEDDDIGHVQKGDATWDALEETAMGKTPENLPAACYETGDIICVVEKPGDLPEASLHVMHNGKQKFQIDEVGVGKAETPTDKGVFTVSPSRMHKIYFSKDPKAHHAAMPRSMFYNNGEAIHFSRLKAEMEDEYPGSNGCVTIGNFGQADRTFEYARAVIGNGGTVKVVIE